MHARPSSTSYATRREHAHHLGPKFSSGENAGGGFGTSPRAWRRSSISSPPGRGCASSWRTGGSFDDFLTAVLIGPKLLDPWAWIASITGEAALSAPGTTHEHLAIQTIVRASQQDKHDAVRDARRLPAPVPARSPLGHRDDVGGRGLRPRPRPSVPRLGHRPRSAEPSLPLARRARCALCASSAPDDVPEKVAGCIIGLRNFFRDKRSRSQPPKMLTTSTLLRGVVVRLLAQTGDVVFAGFDRRSNPPTPHRPRT